jgi:beta-N-acetylhexosaminidase
LIARKVSIVFRVTLLCATVNLLFPYGVCAQENLVDEIISSMTPEERVGQLFMVDFAGQDVSAESGIGQLILGYKIGAVFISESRGNVLNQGEVPAPLQVSRLTNGLQNLTFLGNGKTIGGQEVFVPLFIAVEQEGNGYPHSHLRTGFTSTLSNMALGATWSEQHAQNSGAIVGQEMATVGVNMLLGPVIDVLDSPRSGGRGDLGVRVFGGSPYWVSTLGRAYIRGVHQGSAQRVLTVAKHFPGHGGSGRDLEGEVSTIDRTLEDMRDLELAPFAAVARFGVDDPLGTTDALMISHIRCQAFQEDVLPFTDPLTLDPDGLGAAMGLPEFASWRATGLLVADFLGVDAIKEHFDPAPPVDFFPYRQIAYEAFMAGNDVLPLVQFSLEEDWGQDDFENIATTIDHFRSLYRDDAQFRTRVDESVRRILSTKIRLYPSFSLDEVLVDESLIPGLVGGRGDEVQQMAEGALTLFHPSYEDLRARLTDSPTVDDDILILECFEDCYATPILSRDAVENTLLRLYGPEGTGQANPDKVKTLSFAQINDWMVGNLTTSDMEMVEALMQDADWVIFALSDYNPDDFPASAALKNLLEDRYHYLSDKKTIAIAYDAPYHLDSAEVSKLTAYFAVYGKVVPCLEASLRPLFEPDFVPVGAAPVNVEGANYDLTTALQPEPAQLIALERLSPEEGALYAGGDPLVVRSGVILDHNGHPVPGGTPVDFTGHYLEEDMYVEPQVVTSTIDGVAGATFWLVLDGLMEVSAVSGEAASDSLRVRVLMPATPFPTFTPSPTATPSPTPTSTPIPPTPTVAPILTPIPTPAPRLQAPPLDWFDFLLAGGGILLGATLGFQARRGRRKGWEREVQIVLYSVALGLIGYILYGLGLLNPARLLGWEGGIARGFLLLFSAVAAFLPSGVAWLRRS